MYAQTKHSTESFCVCKTPDKKPTLGWLRTILLIEWNRFLICDNIDFVETQHELFEMWNRLMGRKMDFDMFDDTFVNFA